MYFHIREKVFERSGNLYALGDFMKLAPGEVALEKTVRFRTIGDITCTGAVESNAKNLDEIIAEVAVARTTERGTRIDDQRSESAMEDRKKQGYF